MTKSTRGTVVVVLVLAFFAGLEWDQWRDRRAADARQRRDIATVEAAAGRLTYDEVSHAWRDLQAGRLSAMAALRDPVGVPGFTTYEDEGAIILVFHSADRCKIDLLVRARVNTVRTRDC